MAGVLGLLATAVLMGQMLLARGDNHDSLCYGDQLGSSACLTAVKNQMIDNTRYWFGVNYTAQCPFGTFSSSCSNGDREHLSLLTRLEKNQTVSTSSITQVLNVTFNVPAGSYIGCGNTYQVDATTLTLDPLRETHITLWAADHKPSVRWSAPNRDQLYTVFVWDAGALILHGMFYNIRGGDIENGKTAFNYRGPKNPSNREQPYVFLLYEQATELDDNIVSTAVIAELPNQQKLTPSLITSKLSGMTGPVGVSVMSVRADPYSFEYMKQNNIVNNCPFLLTPVFASLPLQYDVRTASLTVSIDVTFKRPETTLVSCCQEISYEANERMTNPLGNGVLMPIYTREQPHIKLVNFNPFDTYIFYSTLYTILMLDVTEDLVPDLQNPDTTLLWQVLNFRQQGDKISGDTTMPYQAPLPLTGRGNRIIMVLLLRQTGFMETTGLNRFVGNSCPSRQTGRCSFNLASFVTELGLTIDGASWFVTTVDAWSRQESVRLGLMDKSMACLGVPQYADPCPDIPCTSTNAASSSLPLAASLLAVLAVCGSMLKDFA